ncbi:V-type proton ATPase subunit a2 [Galdieria sulphuraria]|nr:V-type proton ATPase subunit a2 [Galdieria sulphuraria]
MVKVRLFIDRSAARATLEGIGEHGLLQLEDLNQNKSEFQRSFSSGIRQCLEMQRKLRALEVDVRECFPSRSFNNNDSVSREELNSITLDELDRHLSNLEETVQEMNMHWKSLNSHRQQLLEHHYVLVLGSHLFRPGYLSLMSEESSHVNGNASSMNVKLKPNYTPVDMETTFLRLIAGVISLPALPLFQRLVFRIARGNCLCRFSEIEEVFYDEEKKENVRSSVFVIFCPGKELGLKIQKLCEAFGAHLYHLPDDEITRRSLLAQVSNRLQDIETVVGTTHSQRLQTLSEIGAKLALWSEKVLREKAIFHCMNMLNYDTSRNIYIAEGWTPKDELEQLESLLHEGCRLSRAQVSSVLEHHVSDNVPPTYFRTNKFTVVFQNIVESYGVASYRELNPACFTIITFPFLFAVMFGDVGHGLLMCLFALYLILFEKKLGRKTLNEILQFCYDGRYIILLMGIFSLYTGLIYNEFFGVAMNLFGSRWKFNSSSNFACGIDNCVDSSQSLPPRNIYPIGFDPIWSQASNGLTFFNSYKMKLSIVLGVFQMVMGIFLSYLNARYFQRSLDIYHVFLPQMIFMNAIFGYLVIIIFVKWSINWNSTSCQSNPSCSPPDLKQILIGMFMNPGYLPLDMQLFRGQKIVQILLLVCAIVSVPWMLLPKPLILRKRYKRLENSQPFVSREFRHSDHEMNGNSNTGHSSESEEEAAESKVKSSSSIEKEEFDFGEIFVHQMIHTIEFVLGAVSNTASYLRLWALSLAHSELSEVFLEKVLYGAMALNNSFAVFLGFLVWFGLTIGVLCLMESLSAFLHALRLHWVEFQNKFYNLQGDGRKFVPFSFKSIK